MKATIIIVTSEGDLDVFQPVVAEGHLTLEQMRKAAVNYGGGYLQVSPVSPDGTDVYYVNFSDLVTAVVDPETGVFDGDDMGGLEVRFYLTSVSPMEALFKG
jgi:hypothetical protein